MAINWTTVRMGAAMFLPVVAYEVGEYLLAHSELARSVDAQLRPYAFSASLLIGLVVGLGQLGWQYSRTRKLGSYLIQQLVFLLLFTTIPLALGHFYHGLNTLGLVGLLISAAYVVDAAFGAPLFCAFPLHFKPELAVRLAEPAVRRTIVHIEYAFCLTFALQHAFLIWGNLVLPKATYLLILPFFSKSLWGAFIAFSYGYPAWRRRRSVAREAALERTVPGQPQEARSSGARGSRP